MIDLPLLGFGAGLTALVGTGMWYVARSAGRIHDKLNDINTRAHATNDYDELAKLNKELIAFAEKECWHRHLSSHAAKVNQFIYGKLCALRPPH